MSDPGMMGDTGFEKRLRDNIQRLDEKIDYTTKLLDERIDHLRTEVHGDDKRYTERFNMQEAASKYALEKSNEFRMSLDDIGKKQTPRSEFEAEIKSLREFYTAGLRNNNDKIDELRARIDRNEGRGTIADPMVAQLANKVAALEVARGESSGDKSGRVSQRELIGWFIALAATIAMVILELRR